MNYNASNTRNSVALGTTTADQNERAESGKWWHPQLYRTEEAELVSASCQNDLLTVNLTTRRDDWPHMMAVNVN